MPCYGPDGPPNVRSDVAEGKLARVYKELDQATAAACEMAKCLKDSGLGHSFLSRSTLAWIREHNKLDAKRSRK